MKHPWWGIVIPMLWFTACGGDGKDVAQIEPEGDNFVYLATYDGPSFVEITDVTVSGTAAFLCTGVQGVLIYDIHDPLRMERISQARFSNGFSRFPRCQHVVVSGDRAFVAHHGDELQPSPWITVFDASDLSAVTELAFHKAPGHPYEGLTVREDLLYAAVHEAGIEVFRIETDGRLTSLAQLQEGLENSWQIALAGDDAFVADGIGGLKVVDVQDPTHPRPAGGAETSGVAQDIVVSGDFAFVAAGGGGLDIFDITDPHHPTLAANVDTPGSVLRLALSKGRAYLANWNDIRVVDVTDPRSPALLAVETAPVRDGQDFSRILAIDAQDDFAFAGEWTGLQSYRLFPDVKAPDIFVQNDRIDFGRVAPGSRYDFPLLLHNEGQIPLEIERIEIASGPFAVDPPPLSIPPGGSAPLTIHYTPDDEGEDRTRLTLVSNDPDEGGLGIDLVGNLDTLQVGDPAPDFLLHDLDGKPYRLSDFREHVVVLAYFATF